MNRSLLRRIPGLILTGVAVLLTACGGGGGGSNPPANVAPIARAGSAQTVGSGVAVTLNGAASSDSDGTIASYAWTQTGGGAVALTGAATATPSFTAPVVTAVTTLTFSLTVTDDDGAASAPSSVNVTVSPPVAGNVTVAGTVRFARVPFNTPSTFGLNYAAPVLQPARGVIVQALDAGSQAVLATGATDAAGAYSLSVAGNTSITIRAVARMTRDTAQPLPRWDVRVQATTAASGTPYSFTGAAFNSNAGTHNLDIPTGISAGGAATGARASGPFATLDTLYTAIQTVLTVAPNISFPPLIVAWDSTAPGTFFSARTTQYISLNGDLTEDTDEFDQHVIAHEFGHYLEHNFSRADNLGGSHGLGDRLDPRVAFGEGFGYAFAAIVLNDPFATDSFVSSGAQRAGRFNIELNPATTPPGQSGDQIGCWCSESSVWSILWDIYDSTSDANDTLALGLQPIWDVLVGPQRTTPAFTTIFSFITALKAAQPAHAAAIDVLVTAQNIHSAGIDAFATAETNTPYPARSILPIYSTITPGTPVVVQSIGDGGFYNKAGNRRFLRFSPVTNGTATVTVTTSNPNPQPDPDFWVWQSGGAIVFESPPALTETGTFPVIAGRTYIIDAYECANGCDSVQGVRGAYNLSVSLAIN